MSFSPTSLDERPESSGERGAAAASVPTPTAESAVALASAVSEESLGEDHDLATFSDDPTPPISPCLTNSLRYDFRAPSAGVNAGYGGPLAGALGRRRFSHQLGVPRQTRAHMAGSAGVRRGMPAATVVVVKSASAHSFKCWQRRSSSVEDEFCCREDLLLENDASRAAAACPLPNIAGAIRHVPAQAMAIVGVSPTGETWTPRFLVRKPFFPPESAGEVANLSVNSLAGNAVHYPTTTNSLLPQSLSSPDSFLLRPQGHHRPSRHKHAPAQWHPAISSSSCSAALSQNAPSALATEPENNEEDEG